MKNETAVCLENTIRELENLREALSRKRHGKNFVRYGFTYVEGKKEQTAFNLYLIDNERYRHSDSCLVKCGDCETTALLHHAELKNKGVIYKVFGYPALDSDNRLIIVSGVKYDSFLSILREFERAKIDYQ